MIIKVIGNYINRTNDRVFVVHKRTNEIFLQPINGNNRTFGGSYDYITECGIDLKPLDDNENSFELIQIDGVIVRQSI